MRLTNEQVASYQKIYLETFGRPISKDEALVQALALVRLVRVMTQLTNEETINKENHREQDQIPRANS
jgi:hypothetical protein